MACIFLLDSIVFEADAIVLMNSTLLHKPTGKHACILELPLLNVLLYFNARFSISPTNGIDAVVYRASMEISVETCSTNQRTDAVKTSDSLSYAVPSPVRPRIYSWNPGGTYIVTLFDLVLVIAFPLHHLDDYFEVVIRTNSE